MLCPSGAGFDSYRLWEALLLGAIPVMEVRRRQLKSAMEVKVRGPGLLLDPALPSSMTRRPASDLLPLRQRTPSVWV